jgi:metal-responsive CopG/Arc/MetJ family transcriptional regulator
MSHRLQSLIPEELNARIENAAQRGRTSKGAWVRQAIEAALERREGQESGGADPLLSLASLGAPTADINDMIAEIGSGRS